MVCVCGGIKGGSGKSTLAVNISIMLAAGGGEILLVDADDQGSVQDFTIVRTDELGEAGYTCIALRGKAIRNEVLKLVGKYDHVVIDCGGRDTTNQRAALTVADVYLIPFVPRSFDVWTLDQVSKLVDDMGAVNPSLQPFIVLNKADPTGQDNQEAIDYFKDFENLGYLDAPLGNRKAFAKAASEGKAVVEHRPTDQKAIDEITKLLNLVTEIKVVSS